LKQKKGVKLSPKNLVFFKAKVFQNKLLLSFFTFSFKRFYSHHLPIYLPGKSTSLSLFEGEGEGRRWMKVC
jgi:hypothetical protein